MRYRITESQLSRLTEDDERETPSGGKDPSLLKFSTTGNAKIKHPSFSLPAGHTCPFAKDCRSCADPQTGKLSDDPNIRFRCFAASQEALYGNLRKMRWHNYNLLRGNKDVNSMADLIERSLRYHFPKGIPMLRLHVGGDFYDNVYFAAWAEVARRFPSMDIYAYTKSLPFWVKHKDSLPSNFILKASEGGMRDDLITAHNLPSAAVYYTQADADKAGVPVDHDDSLASDSRVNKLGLLLHGTQPKGTEAAAAREKLRKGGFKGYGRKGKK